MGWLLRIRPSVRRWTLFIYWILLFSATHFPNLDRYRPKEGWPVSDLFIHFASYAVWSTILYWVLDAGRVAKWRSFWGVFLLGLIYGVFDEWTQSLVARSSDFNDLAADIIGVLFGWVVAHLTVLRFRRP